MKTAEQNYRVLHEIEANRLFLLMAYQQNPDLLERADARIKQIFEAPVLHDHPLPQSIPREEREPWPVSIRRKNGEGDKQRGFTLVELITVIVIVGIISAIAVPRMFDRGLFDSRGFYDQTISTLRYAQKTAIAQHRFVCVAFAANSITLTYGATAACGNDLTSPIGQTPYTVPAPNGVFLVGAVGNNFNFDPLGRPSFAGAPLPISVSGYTSSNVCIAAQTGYVYGQAVC